MIVLDVAAIVKLLPSAAPRDDFGVAFAPGTRIEEIGALLEASWATIVDGPHSGFSKNPWADPPTE